MPVTSWFKPEGAMKGIAREQKRRMSKAAHTLAADVKRSFQKTGKTGKKRRAFKGGQNKALYWPSKPGEVPAIQGGDLKRSIIAEVKSDGDEYVGMVGPMAMVGGKSLKYAKWLEFGTRKMKARPFLRPAIVRLKNELYRILARG